MHSANAKLSCFPLCGFLSHTSKERGDTASPKFIVTLDGVPSPLGNVDMEMELDDVRPPVKVTETTSLVHREPKVSILHRLQGVVTSSEGEGSFFYLWDKTALY